MSTLEFFQRLTGTNDPWDFFFFFFWAMCGATLMMAMDIQSREKKGGWCWRFFFRDNLWRLIGTPVLVFFYIKFSIEMDGSTVTDWRALTTGLGIDGVLMKLKSFRASKQALRNG